MKKIINVMTKLSLYLVLTVILILSIRQIVLAPTIPEYMEFYEINSKYKIIKNNELLSFIYNYSRTNYINPCFILSVIYVESGGKIRAISKYGAIGLMQIIPELGLDYGYSREQLFNPYINIVVGVKYLSRLIKKYNDIDIVLTCYLCGENYYKTRPAKSRQISSKYINNIKQILADSPQHLSIPMDDINDIKGVKVYEKRHK